MVAVRSWDIGDGSAVDFIVGHLEGRWTGDEESMQRAVLAGCAATLMEFGCDSRLAVDRAMELIEDGIAVGWDGKTLTFERCSAEASDLNPRRAGA